MKRRIILKNTSLVVSVDKGSVFEIFRRKSFPGPLRVMPCNKK